MNAAAAAIRARWSERVQAIPKGAHGRPAAIKRYNDACARLERLERYPEQPAPLSGGGAAVAARLYARGNVTDTRRLLWSVRAVEKRLRAAVHLAEATAPFAASTSYRPPRRARRPTSTPAGAASAS